MIEIGIDHSVEIDKDKTLDLIIEDNYKIDIYNVDVIVGEKAIDAKIMITEVTVETEGDKIFRRNFSNDRYDSRDRNRSRTREKKFDT